MLKMAQKTCIARYACDFYFKWFLFLCPDLDLNLFKCDIRTHAAYLPFLDI